MQIICLEEKAFYELIGQVVERLRQKHTVKDKWISDEEAMEMLNIKSKTTLQKLRDEGRIKFTEPQKNNIIRQGKI